MAWEQRQLGGGDSGDAYTVWYNTDTGETSYTNPNPPSQGYGFVQDQYVNSQGQQFSYNPEVFQTIWNNTPGSARDKFEAVVRGGLDSNQRHSGGTAHALEWLKGTAPSLNLTQADANAIMSSGYTQQFMERMQDNRGFTLGNNELGMWPVALGMMAGAAFAPTGAEAGAGASAGAAESGVAASSAGEFTGGFTGTASGAPGFSGQVAGTPGMAAAPAAGSSLAPGYFGAETLGAGAGLYGSAATGAGGATALDGGAAASGAGGGAGTSGVSSLLSNPQVLGGLAGAGLGLLGSQGSQAKTIQTEEGIPDWLMPYVQPALNRYSTEVQNYNVDPYGIMPAAAQQFKDTVSGMYLDPSTNKYLEDYFKLGAERIRGQLSPSFGHMQAFGQHSGYNEALSRGLGDYATGLYGGAYERERDRQNQMIAASPAFLGQSASANFAPYQQYLSTVGGLGKKKEEPYFTNPWGSVLGGAMFGSQIGGAFR